MNLIGYLTADTPPDTSLYMLVAYGVIFIMTGAYLVSLAIRWHRLQARTKRYPPQTPRGSDGSSDTSSETPDDAP